MAGDVPHRFPWLNFKLFGIIFSRENKVHFFYFRVHWLSDCFDEVFQGLIFLCNVKFPRRLEEEVHNVAHLGMVVPYTHNSVPLGSDCRVCRMQTT